MNLKRIFGALLTILGIAGLIFAAVSFVNSNGNKDLKAFVIYGLLGLVFFVSGIQLIRSTRDDT